MPDSSVSGRPLYDGNAGLRLMYDPELRRAKGHAHIDTLRALVGTTIAYVEDGNTDAAVDGAKAAAEYARRLGRELTKVAKQMEDAAALVDEGFSR